ncbi:hypothetical protein HK101_010289 [Irineochytrium annulatum]|nr:hypothetical protein HK101_010289 [Irineochytrium annulatum]
MSTSPSSAVGDAGDVQADQHALPLPALDTPTAAPGENRDGGDSVKTCDPAFVDSNETLSAENANAATELEASEVVEASPHRDCIPASSVRPSISETTLHTKTAGAAELSPTVPVVAPLALASTGVAGEVSLGAPSLATTGAEFNNDFVDNEDDARDESSHAAILDSDAGPEVTEPVAGAGDVEQLKTEDDNKELGDTLTTDATAEGSQGVEATSAGDATSQKGVGAEASENAALRPPHSNARTKPLFHSDTDARARTDQSRAIEGAPNLPETLILSSVIQTTEASTADGQARTFLPCVVCTLFTISFQSKDVALITASRIESDSVAKPETEATFPPQPSSTAIEDDYSRLWETPTTESRRSSSTSQPRPTAVSAPSSYSFATRGGKPVVTIFAGEDADEHLLYGEGDEPVVEEAEPDVDEAARLAREEEARKFRSNAEPDKHRGKFTGHWPRPGDPPRPKGGTPEPFKPKEEVRNASKPNNYLESLERDWEAQWGSIAGAPPRQETVAKDHEFPRTFNFLPENVMTFFLFFAV